MEEVSHFLFSFNHTLEGWKKHVITGASAVS